MSEATDTLLRPFRLKGLELKNRIVMAPMTRGMAEGGIPGQKQADYYRRRAEGGVGLILPKARWWTVRLRAICPAFRSSTAKRRLRAGRA